MNELERRGLIRAVIIQEKPRLVRWVLTEKGRDTFPIAEGYVSYATKWYPGSTLRNRLDEPVKEPSILQPIERDKQRTIS